ncbi:flagellar assembly peptidoglycan hydrolase FlgJ [Marinagarivorans algicola]|uniref:flagellar assembly peptidoglycan hydrolase FlgJ n=1 Tax=Marinagarivorans algicola TaxID=1513270 RepID=UPI00373592C7
MPDFISSNSQVRQAQQVAAYTDLNSLQKIKSEEDKDIALQQVAKQFESMFVSILFKGMRQANAVFEKGNMGHSNAEKMYRDMYDQQLSLNISQSRGLGIADVVYRQLKGNVPRQANVQEFKIDDSQKLLGLSPYLKADQQFASSLTPEQKANGSKITTEKNRNRASDITPPVSTASSGNISGIPLEAKTPLEFAQQLLPMAKKIAGAVGLDPLMTIAQAALETGWGQHVIKDALGQSSYNLFNIKADSRWKGESVSTNTLEYRNGIPQKETARFRRYNSIEEGLRDFVDFMQSNPRYTKALSTKDNPTRFIHELQQAGYATDPAYAQKVQSVYRGLQKDLAPNIIDQPYTDRAH